jgi:hypothetical protein
MPSESEKSVKMLSENDLSMLFSVCDYDHNLLPVQERLQQCMYLDCTILVTAKEYGEEQFIAGASYYCFVCEM